MDTGYLLLGFIAALFFGLLFFAGYSELQLKIACIESGRTDVSGRCISGASLGEDGK